MNDYYHESEIPLDLLEFFEEVEPPTIPCIVADIFLGKGTTLRIASRLRRRGIGIELSKEYAAMAVGELEKPQQIELL